MLNHTDTSGSYALSPVISGSGLVVAYNGTTVVTGANTYSGGTAINGGTLQISRDTNLGAAPGPLSFDGGTLQTTATFATARPTTLNAGGGTFDVQSGGPDRRRCHRWCWRADQDRRRRTYPRPPTGTGGTTISGRDAQLGNGGTSGEYPR